MVASAAINVDLVFGVPAGDTATLLATRSTVQSETPQQLDVLAQLGLTDIASSDATADLNFSQLDEAATDNLIYDGTTGQPFAISNTAADFEAHTPTEILADTAHAIRNPGGVLTAQYQGDLTLSSDQVLAFEIPTATLRLSAVNPGDTATLLATRSTVQSETPQQLDVLAQLGLTDIASSDATAPTT